MQSKGLLSSVSLDRFTRRSEGEIMKISCNWDLIEHFLITLNFTSSFPKIEYRSHTILIFRHVFLMLNGQVRIPQGYIVADE